MAGIANLVGQLETTMVTERTADARSVGRLDRHQSLRKLGKLHVSTNGTWNDWKQVIHQPFGQETDARRIEQDTNCTLHVLLVMTTTVVGNAREGESLEAWIQSKKC